MGFDSHDSTKLYLKSSGQRFLETQEGLAMFDRLLAQDYQPGRFALDDFEKGPRGAERLERGVDPLITVLETQRRRRLALLWLFGPGRAQSAASANRRCCSRFGT